jgi:hypothetical protein
MRRTIRRENTEMKMKKQEVSGESVLQVGCNPFLAWSRIKVLIESMPSLRALRSRAKQSPEISGVFGCEAFNHNKIQWFGPGPWVFNN